MDAVLLQELFPGADADDTQLEIELADLEALAGAGDDEPDRPHAGTPEAARDPSRDHVQTVTFSREQLEAETQPVPREKAEVAVEARPSRRIALGSVAAPLAARVPRTAAIYPVACAEVDITPSFENALPFPVESLPFERVELAVIEPPKLARHETEIIDRGTSTTVTVVAVMICLMALSVATVLLVMR